MPCLGSLFNRERDKYIYIYIYAYRERETERERERERERNFGEGGSPVGNALMCVRILGPRSTMSVHHRICLVIPHILSVGFLFLLRCTRVLSSSPPLLLLSSSSPPLPSPSHSSPHCECVTLLCLPQSTSHFTSYVFLSLPHTSRSSSYLHS